MTKLEWGQGRKRFLALKDDIATDLRAGKLRREIWEERKDQLLLGYSGFARLVSRYIEPAHSIRPAKSSEPISGPGAASSPSRHRWHGGESNGQNPGDIRPVAKPREQVKLVFDKSPDPERIRRLLRPPEPKRAPE